MPRRYEIPATPENMVWGYLDCSHPPVLEINSGDSVTLHSFPAGGKETLPDDLCLVPEDYLTALETMQQDRDLISSRAQSMCRGASPATRFRSTSST